MSALRKATSTAGDAASVASGSTDGVLAAPCTRCQKTSGKGTPRSCAVCQKPYCGSCKAKEMKKDGAEKWVCKGCKQEAASVRSTKSAVSGDGVAVGDYDCAQCGVHGSKGTARPCQDCRKVYCGKCKHKAMRRLQKGVWQCSACKAANASVVSRQPSMNGKPNHAPPNVVEVRPTEAPVLGQNGAPSEDKTIAAPSTAAETHKGGDAVGDAGHSAGDDDGIESDAASLAHSTASSASSKKKRRKGDAIVSRLTYSIRYTYPPGEDGVQRSEVINSDIALQGPPEKQTEVVSYSKHKATPTASLSSDADEKGVERHDAVAEKAAEGGAGESVQRRSSRRASSAKNADAPSVAVASGSGDVAASGSGSSSRRASQDPANAARLLLKPEADIYSISSLEDVSSSPRASESRRASNASRAAAPGDASQQGARSPIPAASAQRPEGVDDLYEHARRHMRSASIGEDGKRISRKASVQEDPAAVPQQQAQQRPRSASITPQYGQPFSYHDKSPSPRPRRASLVESHNARPVVSEEEAAQTQAEATPAPAAPASVLSLYLKKPAPQTAQSATSPSQAPGSPLSSSRGTETGRHSPAPEMAAAPMGWGSVVAEFRRKSVDAATAETLLSPALARANEPGATSPVLRRVSDARPAATEAAVPASVTRENPTLQRRPSDTRRRSLSSSDEAQAAHARQASAPQHQRRPSSEAGGPSPAMASAKVASAPGGGAAVVRRGSLSSAAAEAAQSLLNDSMSDIGDDDDDARALAEAAALVASASASAPKSRVQPAADERRSGDSSTDRPSVALGASALKGATRSAPVQTAEESVTVSVASAAAAQRRPSVGAHSQPRVDVHSDASRAPVAATPPVEASGLVPSVARRRSVDLGDSHRLSLDSTWSSAHSGDGDNEASEIESRRNASADAARGTARGASVQHKKGAPDSPRTTARKNAAKAHAAPASAHSRGAASAHPARRKESAGRLVEEKPPERATAPPPATEEVEVEERLTDILRRQGSKARVEAEARARQAAASAQHEAQSSPRADAGRRAEAPTAPAEQRHDVSVQQREHAPAVRRTEPAAAKGPARHAGPPHATQHHPGVRPGSSGRSPRRVASPGMSPAQSRVLGDSASASPHMSPSASMSGMGAPRHASHTHPMPRRESSTSLSRTTPAKGHVKWAEAGEASEARVRSPIARQPTPFLADDDYAYSSTNDEGAEESEDVMMPHEAADVEDTAYHGSPMHPPAGSRGAHRSTAQPRAEDYDDGAGAVAVSRAPARSAAARAPVGPSEPDVRRPVQRVPSLSREVWTREDERGYADAPEHVPYIDDRMQRSSSRDIPGTASPRRPGPMSSYAAPPRQQQRPADPWGASPARGRAPAGHAQQPHRAAERARAYDDERVGRREAPRERPDARRSRSLSPTTARRHMPTDSYAPAPALRSQGSYGDVGRAPMHPAYSSPQAYQAPPQRRPADAERSGRGPAPRQRSPSPQRSTWRPVATVNRTTYHEPGVFCSRPDCRVCEMRRMEEDSAPEIPEIHVGLDRIAYSQLPQDRAPVLPDRSRLFYLASSTFAEEVDAVRTGDPLADEFAERYIALKTEIDRLRSKAPPMGTGTSPTLRTARRPADRQTRGGAAGAAGGGFGQSLSSSRTGGSMGSLDSTQGRVSPRAHYLREARIMRAAEIQRQLSSGRPSPSPLSSPYWGTAGYNPADDVALPEYEAHIPYDDEDAKGQFGYRIDGSTGLPRDYDEGGEEVAADESYDDFVEEPQYPSSRGPTRESAPYRRQQSDDTVRRQMSEDSVRSEEIMNLVLGGIYGDARAQRPAGSRRY